MHIFKELLVFFHTLNFNLLNTVMLLAHASCPPSSEVDCRVFSMVKDHLLTLAHLFGTVCLKHSATLILPPLLKPPSRRTCSITISKLFFTAVLIPSSNAQVCVCVCLSVASVVVKRPALPPCAVDGHSTNPLYYYYMQFFCTPFTKCSYFTKKKLTMEMKLYLNVDVHQDSVHI